VWALNREMKKGTEYSPRNIYDGISMRSLRHSNSPSLSDVRVLIRKPLRSSPILPRIGHTALLEMPEQSHRPLGLRARVRREMQ
jgi:hypothetical protein